jgi:hypothetical protein
MLLLAFAETSDDFGTKISSRPYIPLLLQNTQVV